MNLQVFSHLSSAYAGSKRGIYLRHYEHCWDEGVQCQGTCDFVKSLISAIMGAEIVRAFLCVCVCRWG